MTRRDISGLLIFAAVIFAAGHLLFVREGTLLAQPFDPKQLKTTGDAFPIVEGIAVNPTNGRAYACRHKTVETVF